MFTLDEKYHLFLFLVCSKANIIFL